MIGRTVALAQRDSDNELPNDDPDCVTLAKDPAGGWKLRWIDGVGRAGCVSVPVEGGADTPASGAAVVLRAVAAAGRVDNPTGTRGFCTGREAGGIAGVSRIGTVNCDTSG